MALTFPDPSVEPRFVAPNGITYSWDATDEKWVVGSFSAGGGIYYDDDAPNPELDDTLQLTEGDLWVNSDSLLMYVWTGEDWVEIGSACGGIGGGGGIRELITTRDVKTISRDENPFEIVQDLSDALVGEDPTTQDPIDDLLKTQEDVNDFIARVSERTLKGINRTTDNLDFLQNTTSAGTYVRKEKPTIPSAPLAGECLLLQDGGAEATTFDEVQNVLFHKSGVGPFADFSFLRVGDNFLIQNQDDGGFGLYVVRTIDDFTQHWDISVDVARNRTYLSPAGFDEGLKFRATRPVFTVAQDNEPTFSESGQLWYDTANDLLKVWDQEDGQFYTVGGEDAGPKPDITGRERVYISAGQDPYGVQEGEISAGLVNDTNLSFHVRPPDPNFFVLGETYIINGIETTLTTVEHRDENHALGHAHTYFKTADGINIGPKGTAVTIVGPEEYLRLTGGTLTGELTLDTNGDTFNIKKPDGTSLLKAFTGNYSEDVTYWKLADGYGNSKFEIVNRFLLEDYVSSQLSSSSTLTGAKLLEFAQDTPIASLRPGQFTLKNGNTYTNKWSTCTSLTMKATDADGNYLFRSTTQPDGFTSYLGSAMTALDAAGEQSFMRVVPTGAAGGYVVVSYAKDVDLISVEWAASACSQLLCEGDPYVTNGTEYLIHIPDLFF